ncbi:hypothetical protein GJ744_001853 [Endocarpon pusillum]|uniref:Uncharacterized protein n=1 Tax=Endocarpon pusillum TaxID=364733 RepID=A0A8H7AW93_9EURO|nr:hypothetical protein GJ744_001853 [Endocarpon pusillum]
MENVSSLICEIDNLLTGTTEDALKSFGRFLQNENIGQGELAIWALAKPCQIVPLAKVVIDLKQEPSIFRSLAVLPTFVNTVLETDPSCLEDRLDRTDTGAASNPSQRQRLHCAALVAHYTLKKEALPIATQQLVQDAIVSAAESPTEANIRCLSDVLSALPGSILDFFTEKSLSRLSTRCNDICSGSTKREEFSRIMLAQDVLAQVAVAFQTPQSPSKSSLETPPGVKFSEKCRKRVFKLFSGSNALSALKLIVLYLSVFCSEDPGSSPLLPLEAMILAQRIIAPISVPVRRQWVEEYPLLIEKFLSRLNREALGLKIRLEGVMFCFLLFGADSEMALSLKKVASAVLVAVCDPKSSHDSAVATGNDKAIAEILVRLCSSKASPNRTLPGKSAIVTRMLSFIVEQCQPWCTNAVNTVLKLHQAKSILSSLHSASNRSSILPYIVDFIQFGYVPDWWGSEVTFPLSLRDSEVVNCIGDEVCSDSLERLRLELATSFSSLLLTAAWHSGRSLQQPETCQRLLNRLKESSSGTSDTLCSYSCDHTMGLEYNVALIEAQTECEALRARLQNETAQRISLEDQLAQTKRLRKEEKDASNALENYLESAERECADMKDRLRQSREDYTELLADADRKVQAVEFKHVAEQVNYRAELLGREKELEMELEEVEFDLEHKEEELQLEKQKGENVEAEMKAALAQADGQIEELRLAVAEKDKALEEAESLRMKLVALLGGRVD